MAKSTATKIRSLIALFMSVVLCANIVLSATSTAYAVNDTDKKYYYALNSNTMVRDTILLHEYNEMIYIPMNDLCALTRSSSTLEKNVFTVTQGIWQTTFDFDRQVFSDGYQSVETALIISGPYYLVPALEFLTYFGADTYIDNNNKTFYCFMPDCTAWEAMAVDYENTLVDIYDLYGGESSIKFSLTLDILMDFILNGSPNSDEYIIDAYSEALAVNLSDFTSVQDYQKERDESLYNYLISDEGQEAAEFATTLLDGSISGIEYLSETYYNTISLKFSDLVKNSYRAGWLDESTHYAGEILNGYRKNKAIADVSAASKIPLTQVVPVFVQTALESAQQLKYAAATNNLAYRVMGSENRDYLGLNVGDNDWFRLADTYKNTVSAVSNSFLGNAVTNFSDMVWDQLIEDCVQSFTGTSALLFSFSKECATSFVKWFPLTRSSVQAFKSDQRAIYLSELQQNVAYVIANIDFSRNYENEELYQKYIEAALLYCRVSIAMYENLITMVSEFGNNQAYWSALFQKRIDALSVSMYKLTLFQDDGVSSCIPLDLLQFRTESSVKGSAVVDITFSRIEEIDKTSNMYMEYARIDGIDANGNVQWNYTTEKYEIAQLQRVSEIGQTEDHYYLCESGTIVALNPDTGEVMWKNDEFQGAPISYIDTNGSIYLCGYLGPDFFAVNAEGQTLCRIESFSEQYYWPYMIEKLGNSIAITFENGPGGYRKDGSYVFYVDLNDFSYALGSKMSDFPQTQPDNQADPIWDAYKVLLQQYPESTHFMDDLYIDTEYTLYDIDKNSTPELIIRENLHQYHIYTFSDDIAMHCGDFYWYYDNCLYGFDGKGLIVHDGGIGNLHLEYVLLYTLTDGILEYTDAIMSTEECTYEEIKDNLKSYIPIKEFYSVNDYTPMES